MKNNKFLSYVKYTWKLWLILIFGIIAVYLSR